MQLRFPLPAGYFAKFDLLPNEAQSYRSLASDIVRETKRDLDHYIKDGRNLIDAHTWKLAKSKERLHCYRKRNTQNSSHQLGLYGNTGTDGGSLSGTDSIGQMYSARSQPFMSVTSSHSRSGHEDMGKLSVSTRSSDDGEPSRKGIQPAVIGYGIVDGTVDDLVYGLFQSSTDEMKTLSAFLGDDSLIDCAALKTIRQTRSSYLGLKWKLSRTVGGNRDCCYMEYVGVSEDANGQRFGYHVLESVVVRNCPQFDDNSIVRTNLSFCFIFRPGKLADQVEVFMEGAYDSSADVLTAGGVGDYRTSMDMLFNLPTAMVGAEAKKISAMVAKQSGALRGASSKNQSGNHCSICRAKSGLLSSHTNCQTCGAVICSKCRIRKVTFSRRGKIKVSCCKMCMVMVKDQSPFAGEQLEQQPAKPMKKAREDSRSRNDSTSSNTRLDLINASVSTMSLTDSEFSSSYQSWQSSSISSLQSDHDDSFYSSNATSNAMVPLERKMPALMESELPAQHLVTYQSEQQRQYEQQQFQQQEFLMRQRIKQHAGPSIPPIPNQRQPSTREGLYNQMLELQMQAERAYNLTNQNANMMNSRR
ncbi:Zinc finger, FYVE-related [Phytophthora cactorum]|nr:Zinc finger, FYVE-related [Phytophthora cactorum]